MVNCSWLGIGEEAVLQIRRTELGRRNRRCGQPIGSMTLVARNAPEPSANLVPLGTPSIKSQRITADRHTDQSDLASYQRQGEAPRVAHPRSTSRLCHSRCQRQCSVENGRRAARTSRPGNNRRLYPRGRRPHQESGPTGGHAAQSLPIGKTAPEVPA